MTRERISPPVGGARLPRIINLRMFPLGWGLAPQVTKNTNFLPGGFDSRPNNKITKNEVQTQQNKKYERHRHKVTPNSERAPRGCTTGAPRGHRGGTTGAPRGHHGGTTGAPRGHHGDHGGTTGAPRGHHGRGPTRVPTLATEGNVLIEEISRTPYCYHCWWNFLPGGGARPPANNKNTNVLPWGPRPPPTVTK